MRVESNTEKDLGYTDRMGPLLRAEVERQLLNDFQRYAQEQSDTLAIDWSDTCPEGHTAVFLDGELENWSDAWVVNLKGERIAWGWIEFVHGGGDNPLFVFWHYLHFGKDSEDVVQTHNIPKHIWERLPESSKDLCMKSGEYDSKWSKDPQVIQWRNQKSQL